MIGRRKLKGREAQRGADVSQWHADWALAWASLEAGRTQGWEPPTRILIEQADAGLAWATERALQRKGWDVVICPGPEKLSGNGCRLLAEGRCSAVESADAILFALPLSDEKSRSILQAHRKRLGTRPVCVETTVPQAEQYDDVLRDFTVLCEPVFATAVVDKLEEALTASTP